MERYCLTGQSPQRAVAPTEKDILVYIVVIPRSLPAFEVLCVELSRKNSSFITLKSLESNPVQL